jgi:hypothetical protein
VTDARPLFADRVAVVMRLRGLSRPAAERLAFEAVLVDRLSAIHSRRLDRLIAAGCSHCESKVERLVRCDARVGGTQAWLSSSPRLGERPLSTVSGRAPWSSWSRKRKPSRQ